MLMFRKKRLEQLTILQPGHSKIIDARQAFWKERTEKQRKQRELANTWKRITDNDDAMLLACTFSLAQARKVISSLEATGRPLRRSILT